MFKRTLFLRLKEKRVILILCVVSMFIIIATCDVKAPKRKKNSNFGQTTEQTAIDPTSSYRSMFSLDGKWTFTPEGFNPREVDVPCIWEATPDPRRDLQCPGYLEGTPDAAIDSIELAGWDKRTVHKGTYSRDINIPSPSAVTKIWFESIHHQAKIFFNDVEVGVHIGPFINASFDVSKAVKSGNNTLRVELTDGTALTTTKPSADNFIANLGLPDNFVTRALVNQFYPGAEKKIPLWPVAYFADTETTGLYRSVTLESLPEIFVDDVYIVPSTQRKDLTVEVTVTNATERENTVLVKGLVFEAAGDTSSPVLEIKGEILKVPAQSSATIVLIQAWPNPTLWSPIDPHLYVLRTTVSNEAEKIVDIKENRFGFREVSIEKGNFMLNGQRFNLLGDSISCHEQHRRYWAKRYFSCETAKETLQKIKKLNFNAVRFHQGPPQNCVHDLADELGLLVIAESAIFSRMDIYPPLSIGDTYMENAKKWLEKWIKDKRNHPSIVMWSVENEMYLFGFPMKRELVYSLQEPVKQFDVITRPDGVKTVPRPVNWDGDSSLLFSTSSPPIGVDGLINNIPGLFARLTSAEVYPVETINLHYPAGSWGTTDPEKEWFSDAIANYEKFLVSDVPVGVGETLFDRRKKLEENFPGVTLTQVKAMQSIAVRAMRIIGFDDIRPFQLHWAWQPYYPDGKEHPYQDFYHGIKTQEERDRLVNHVAESFHPIAVFDREYTRLPPNPDGTIGPEKIPEKTKITRKLVITNDSFLPGISQKVTWSVVNDAGAQLAGETFEITVDQGFNVARDISFNVPEKGKMIKLIIQDQMEGLPQGDYRVEYLFSTE